LHCRSNNTSISNGTEVNENITFIPIYVNLFLIYINLNR
jgi:hypothetical protein